MSSKYKHVYYDVSRYQGRQNKKPWVAHIGILPDGKRFIASYDTERKAAIAIDKILIKFGKDPVNILTPK